MTHVSSPPLSQDLVDRPRSNVAFAPVLVWLVLNVLALLAAGLRVPFSARFVMPEEQMALHEIFFVQMVASAMLFPFLFRTFATTVVILAVTPLCVLIAGILAAQSEFWPLVLDCAYPTLVLGGLAVWAYVLRGTKAARYGVGVVLLWVAGGAMMAYSNREFLAPTQSFDWTGHLGLGPLVGGIALLEAGPRTGTVWVGLGSFLFLSLLAGVGRWIWTRSARRSKQPV
jgi:hypothetical protein